MKEKAREFINDYVLWGSSLLGVLILLTQVHMLLSYEFSYKYVIRIVFACVYPVSLFFFGRKCIFLLFCLFSLLIETQSVYDNWTSFFIISIGCRIYQKRVYQVMMILFYAVSMFFVAQLHQKDSVFICFHILTCILIYFGIQVFFTKNELNQLEPLELTEDEKEIIRQLAEGKLQKEITDFNKNTITKKLCQAMERNHCQTKTDLILRYKAFQS